MTASNMLTFCEERTLSSMGNGPNSGERNIDEEYENDGIFKKTFQLGGLHRRKSIDGLIFFAGTDKAPVITEILEERGWSRTKDHSVTNFTIKWCLARQVDWNQFQAGKQLINNIPGQLTFTDKINLWYTTKDYLRNRRTFDGNHIQTFLPMTFILDDENEVAEFLRSYKKQNRTWICKPRYSYAGRGIYVISVNSDLNAIFKFKIGSGNRLQHEPRLPGYLMQEYISRPLLIKGRKFDIRVHWLVAWTKPLLVFYNHNASVVRLSLNLYREFDFDRATHLTNLSVQEHHYRYALAQESTGMTISQLNHYFNQCFRPFHPKMCQDWVMTIMQERMQTIIRHVIRASKDKLTREAGQFGLFGCDFILDENFRIWLLEINDNPGVGWGNPRVNTTTKPLFEETLNIVFECFEKHKKKQPLLPIECLKNYQLIYNEDDDAERVIRDDNQYTERFNIRYAKQESSSRTSFHRILPRANSSRTSLNQNNRSNDDKILPIVKIKNSNPSIIHPTRSSSSIIDATPSNSTIVSTVPVNLSIVNTTSLNSPIVNTSPLSPNIFNTPPLSLTIVNTPSFNPTIINPPPLSPTIVNTPPLSPTTGTRTPLRSSVLGTSRSTSPVVIIPPLDLPIDDTTDNTNETVEPLKHDDDVELERLMKRKRSGKSSKTKSSISTTTNRPTIKINKSNTKRSIGTTNTFTIQRKKHIDLTSFLIDNKRYTYRNSITPSFNEKEKKLTQNKIIFNNEEQNQIEKEDDQSIITSAAHILLPELCSFN